MVVPLQSERGSVVRWGYLMYRAVHPKKELPVQLSARNQLKGTVSSVKLGTVMAEVEIEVGGQTVAAAITRVSAERLGLKVGDQVTAIIKATEVIVAK